MVPSQISYSEFPNDMDVQIQCGLRDKYNISSSPCLACKQRQKTMRITQNRVSDVLPYYIINQKEKQKRFTKPRKRDMPYSRQRRTLETHSNTSLNRDNLVPTPYDIFLPTTIDVDQVEAGMNTNLPKLRLNPQD